MKKRLRDYLFFLILVFPVALQAQDHGAAASQAVQETFLTNRIINFMNTETGPRRSLVFRISHRFGPLNSGIYSLYGVDGPTAIRFSFEYSPADRLTFGLSRSSLGKMFEGYAKYRILQQTTDNKKPFTLSLVTAADITSAPDPGKTTNGYDKYTYFSDRFSYCTQLIAARKFGKRLTVQLNTFYIHYNIVDHFHDKNDIFAAGLAVRYKIRPGMSLSGEYGFRLSNYSPLDFKDYHNPAAIGLDIETGGHVFQIHITNAFGMSEVQFIPYTSGNLLKGGIRLGFNISRTFKPEF